MVAVTASATDMLLKDGRVVEGDHVQVAGVAENPLDVKITAGEVAVLPLIMFDDGLRRTFIHYSQVAQVLDETNDRSVKIRVWQDVAEKGAGIGRVGRGRPLGPFDEFGRRTFEMQSADGPLSIVQGITEITPTYTKIEGLMGAPRPILWDMRLATSSIPREVLAKILKTTVPQNDVDKRLEVVRLYLQSERYRDAEQELAEIIQDFPQHDNLNEQINQLRQLGANLILKEIQLRARAGQRQLAQSMLAKFPNEGVSGTTLEQVRELLGKFSEDGHHKQEVLAALDAEVALIEDVNNRELADDFAKEIAAEANPDALGRLASFERLVDAKDLKPEQKVALAISGWLVGANDATDDFHLAVSLARVRNLVRNYLSEPLAAERSAILGELADQPGATVPRVAQLLKLMKPPLEVPEAAKRGPGLYEFALPGLPGENDSRYYLQLPPEYDPLRRYPVVIALADAGVDPLREIEFWAGPARPDGEPLGQATRQGYITIAVDWLQPKQTFYGYTAREHHAVLGALRDASRRFSIDTDRVFLTGHGVGGDGAWDIALAHPDLWAGVIPFVAYADRYCNRYAENAEYVPWYFVCGELDGTKMSDNARELDRYFGRNKDNTVVEFLGRGYEPFGDELQRLFDWMGRRSRKMPKEFDCVTMRPWDNFFWWLEVNDLPEKSMVAPASWPPARAARPFPVIGKIGPANRVSAKTQAGAVTIYLAPEFVDFSKPIHVELKGRRMTGPGVEIKPAMSVLLEDARTRAERQHPFWAKVESSKAKRDDFTNR
jgi:pimeloyl-ACP methyl ester carboxylesterase